MGVTAVKPQHYAIGGIGMVPAVIVYVYFGSTLHSISDAVQGNFEGGWLSLGLLIVGTVVALVGVTILSIIAGKALKKALKEDKKKEAEAVNVRAENQNEAPVAEDDEESKKKEVLKSLSRDVPSKEVSQ